MAHEVSCQGSYCLLVTSFSFFKKGRFFFPELLTHYDKHNADFTTQSFLSVQFHGIKNIHIIVLPLPPSISETFSIMGSQTEILYPLNNLLFPLLPIHPAPSLRQPLFYFLSLYIWLLLFLNYQEQLITASETVKGFITVKSFVTSLSITF